MRENTFFAKKVQNKSRPRERPPHRTVTFSCGTVQFLPPLYNSPSLSSVLQPVNVLLAPGPNLFSECVPSLFVVPTTIKLQKKEFVVSGFSCAGGGEGLKPDLRRKSKTWNCFSSTYFFFFYVFFGANNQQPTNNHNQWHGYCLHLLAAPADAKALLYCCSTAAAVGACSEKIASLT